jgi:multiple sugar transport system permease protein
MSAPGQSIPGATPSSGSDAGPRRHDFSRRRRTTAAKRLLVHLALLLLCAGAIVPLLWMLSTSFKTLDDAMRSPPGLLPRPFAPRNYVEVIENKRLNFMLWARNSLIIAALVVAGTTVSSSVVAYGFARLRFPGRRVLFGVMIATMMIPFPVTMVSLFTLFRWLGDHTGVQWLGSFKPLWVPAWFGGSAFSIFLLRQFFLTIPRELSEAARIDGCGELGIFFRIFLPLSKPALAIVALLAFVAVWNDFLGPLVYLQRPEQFTLALGLQNYQSQLGGTPWHHLMAATVLVILPALVLFFVAQKSFLQGVSTTGMKG